MIVDDDDNDDAICIELNIVLLYCTILRPSRWEEAAKFSRASGDKQLVSLTEA